MLCLSCYLILLCIPFIEPVKIRVDGSIDLQQNFGFTYTPDMEFMRSLNNTLPPEVSAIIDNITRTTHASSNLKQDETVMPIKRAFRRRFKTAEQIEAFEETTTKMYRKRVGTTRALLIDVQALLESLQYIADIPPPTVTPKDKYKVLKINAKKKMNNRKLKKRTRSFITEKSYDPLVVRITRQMDMDVRHSKNNAKKVKRKRRKGNKRAENNINNNQEKKVSKKVKRKKTTTPKDEDDTYMEDYDPEFYTHKLPSKRTTSMYESLLRTNDPVTPQIIDGQKLIELLERFGIIKTETTTPAHLRMPTQILRERYYKPIPPDDDSGIRDSIHLVKRDRRLQNFTLNVFKQNIEVFDTIKSKVDDPKFRTKVDYLARSYRSKFGDYVKDNQNKKILTRLGTQKVILNTIETSNRIMRRLLDFLIVDMKKKQALRADAAIGWKNLVENEEQQEYVQACQRFNICRSKYSLSSFIADYFNVLLQVDDTKLKQGMDAFTEVIKETDMDKIMDSNMKARFRSNIDAIERAEPNVIRPVLWMFRNMLITKNQPLVVQEQVPRRVVNQTVALMDVIDILDEKIPSTEENLLEWNDLRNSLVQWANGKRNDIVEIMQAFVNMHVRKGVDKMNYELASTLRDKFRLFLRSH